MKILNRGPLGVAIFFFALASACSAMISFRYTSPEQAKELGIEVRYRAAGPDNVWVEITFMPKGELEAFEKSQRGVYADLRIVDDKKQILSAPLRELRAKDGRFSVSFTMQRAQLMNASVWLIDYITHGGTAEALPLHQFVDLEKLAKREKQKALEKDGGSKENPGAAPATPASD